LFGFLIAFRVSFSLRHKNPEKSSIQPAFFHSWKIDFTVIFYRIMTDGNIETWLN